MGRVIEYSVCVFQDCLRFLPVSNPFTGHHYDMVRVSYRSIYVSSFINWYEYCSEVFLELVSLDISDKQNFSRGSM